MNVETQQVNVVVVLAHRYPPTWNLGVEIGAKIIRPKYSRRRGRPDDRVVRLKVESVRGEINPAGAHIGYHCAYTMRLWPHQDFMPTDERVSLTFDKWP